MSNGSLSKLRVEFIDRVNMKLTDPLTYTFGNGIKVIEVPIGFVSDGASIHFLRTIGMWGLYSLLVSYGLRAAIVHDYLYRTPSLGYTKRQADAIFREALIDDGVSRWRTWIIFQGVNIAGGYAWNKYRK